MLSFSISYWDLIKFPCFPDSTERGHRWWKHAQRQGDFTDNSIIIVQFLDFPHIPNSIYIFKIIVQPLIIDVLNMELNIQ
jgi:hypothetical protein